MSTSMSQPHAAHFPYARWHMLPLDAISLTSGFWAEWQTINRQTTLQHGYHMLEQAGNFHNFRAHNFGLMRRRERPKCISMSV